MEDFGHYLVVFTLLTVVILIKMSREIELLKVKLSKADSEITALEDEIMGWRVHYLDTESLVISGDEQSESNLKLKQKIDEIRVKGKEMKKLEQFLTS